MNIPSDFKDRVAALERMEPHLHPVIHNLFAMLPPPGTTFSAADRREWLIALRSVCTLLYGDVGHINITVSHPLNG